MNQQINLLTAVCAGIVSFLSPCVLPLIPGYISFISGISLADLKEGKSPSQWVQPFISTMWFVLGFTLVFVALGASATALGQLFLEKLSLFRGVAGAVLIIFGIHLTGLIRIPFLQYEKKWQVRQAPVNAGGSLLVGAAFAFGWTPCIGPILAGILAVASTQKTIFQGMTLLAAYSFGLGIPFLLTSLGVGAFIRFMTRFRRYLRIIEIASGVLLIAIGILMLTNRLAAFSGQFAFFNKFSL